MRPGGSYRGIPFYKKNPLENTPKKKGSYLIPKTFQKTKTRRFFFESKSRSKSLETNRRGGGSWISKLFKTLEPEVIEGGY